MANRSGIKTIERPIIFSEEFQTLCDVDVEAWNESTMQWVDILQKVPRDTFVTRFYLTNESINIALLQRLRFPGPKASRFAEDEDVENEKAQRDHFARVGLLVYSRGSGESPMLWHHRKDNLAVRVRGDPPTWYPELNFRALDGGSLVEGVLPAIKNHRYPVDQLQQSDVDLALQDLIHAKKKIVSCGDREGNVWIRLKSSTLKNDADPFLDQLFRNLRDFREVEARALPWKKEENRQAWASQVQILDAQSQNAKVTRAHQLAAAGGVEARARVAPSVGGAATAVAVPPMKTVKPNVSQTDMAPFFSAPVTPAHYSLPKTKQALNAHTENKMNMWASNQEPVEVQYWSEHKAAWVGLIPKKNAKQNNIHLELKLSWKDIELVVCHNDGKSDVAAKVIYRSLKQDEVISYHISNGMLDGKEHPIYYILLHKIKMKGTTVKFSTPTMHSQALNIRNQLVVAHDTADNILRDLNALSYNVWLRIRETKGLGIQSSILKTLKEPHSRFELCTTPGPWLPAPPAVQQSSPVKPHEQAPFRAMPPARRSELENRLPQLSQEEYEAWNHPFRTFAIDPPKEPGRKEPRGWKLAPLAPNRPLSPASRAARQAARAAQGTEIAEPAGPTDLAPVHQNALQPQVEEATAGQAVQSINRETVPSRSQADPGGRGDIDWFKNSYTQAKADQLAKRVQEERAQPYVEVTSEEEAILTRSVQKMRLEENRQCLSPYPDEKEAQHTDTPKLCADPPKGGQEPRQQKAATESWLGAPLVDPLCLDTEAPLIEFETLEEREGQRGRQQERTKQESQPSQPPGPRGFARSESRPIYHVPSSEHIPTYSSYLPTPVADEQHATFPAAPQSVHGDSSSQETTSPGENALKLPKSMIWGIYFKPNWRPLAGLQEEGPVWGGLFN